MLEIEQKQDRLVVVVAKAGGGRWRARIRSLGEFARRKPLGFLGAVAIVVLVFTAVFASVIAPYDPVRVSGPSLKPPSLQHLMGTDEIGRDLLSRMIYGARISLWVGIIAVGLGTTAGTAIGIATGYWGGRLDMLVQRVMDSMMAIPNLVLALAIMAALGASITNVMIALAIGMTPATSRIVRGAVLSIKENQYIEAARTVGCQDWRIVTRHVLPNVAHVVIILVTIGLGNAILAEASLSFLGLGTPPPTPSWGGMLSGQSQRYLQIAPWMAIPPGLAIFLAVLGFNLLGDALRDVLDPRMRGSG